MRRVAAALALLVACASPPPPAPPRAEVTTAAAPTEPTPAPPPEATPDASPPLGSPTADAAPSGSAIATPTDGAPAPPNQAAVDPTGCTPAATAFERTARPKIKECYRAGKKDEPELTGGVQILLRFEERKRGPLARVVKTEDATLPAPVVACMTKVIKETPFEDARRCLGRGLTFPIKFPSR